MPVVDVSVKRVSVALSVVSVVIALGSLYLSVRTFRATRPIWRVDASIATIVGTDRSHAAILVEVVNVGRASGAIQRVSIRSTDGTFSTDFHASSNNAVRGSNLPTTLAPTETSVWIFDYTQIRARVMQTNRRYAPALKAILRSGADEHHSRQIPLGATGLPEQPIPFARLPRWLRPLIARATSLVRRWRHPQPQLLGLMILDSESLKAGKVPVHVRNFGNGTARNLVVDMIASKDGVETRVDSVLPQSLKTLRPKREHTFSFPAESAAPPSSKSVEYRWRLHVDAKPSSVKVGVTTREDLDAAIATLEP